MKKLKKWFKQKPEWMQYLIVIIGLITSGIWILPLIFVMVIIAARKSILV